MIDFARDHATLIDTPARGEVAAGAGAGLIGGVAMALFQMLASALGGGSVLAPAKLVAASTLGPRAPSGGLGTLVTGLLLHLAVSAVLGVTFAFALHRRVVRPGATLLAGLFFALLAMLTMTYVLLPWVDPVMRASLVHAPGAWLLAHAVFGLGLGSLPALRRAFGGSERVLLEA
jgi:hypothetical protein